MDCIVHGVAESDTTEWLSLSLSVWSGAWELGGIDVTGWRTTFGNLVLQVHQNQELNKNSRGESDTESGAKTVAKTKGKGLTQLGDQLLWAVVGSIVWFNCRANICFILLILLLSRDSTRGIWSKAGPLSAMWSWTSCLPLLFLCFPISIAEL